MRLETNIGCMVVRVKDETEEEVESVALAHFAAHTVVDIMAILLICRRVHCSNFATLRALMHYDAHSPVLLELEARILTLRDSL